MISYRHAALAFCIFMVCCVSWSEEEIVVNGGFEAAGEKGLPASWSGDTSVFQRDDSVAHSGQASLRYVNSDPGRYVLCTQPAKLAVGRIYDMSVWVKTQGVEGSDSGATICLEWHDSTGKFLGGCYPAGVKGNSDWKQITVRTERVPKEAAGISLNCYLRERMTGTAWFDDVHVTLAKQDPLQSEIAQPNYRKQVPDDGPKDVVVRAAVNLIDYDICTGDVVLKWEVKRGGETLLSGRAGIEEDGKADVSIPVRGLPHGDYTVDVTLARNGCGEALSTRTHSFSRVAPLPSRAAYIDEHNRIIVDGAPFFPLGMYWGAVDEKQVNTYADSAFNCLMPYGAPDKAGMDLCQSRGLKVIYSVKDIYSGESCCPPEIKNEAEEIAFVKQKVDSFREHPALLAWYINDELGQELMPRLSARRGLMEQLDPGHPTWVVLYQVDQVDRYLDSFDVIGTDPYPIPSGPAAKAGIWTRTTSSGVMGARPMWMVPQVFNWACYRQTEEEKKGLRPPTLDEMRSMAWQCIAEGANGLVFYSWFDLHRDPSTPFDVQWGRVKQVAQEVADYIPVLLSVEKTPAIKSAGTSYANWTLRKLAGKTFLFAANPDSAPHTTGFEFPSRPTTLFSKGMPLGLEGGVLRLELKPFEVQIIEATGL